MTALVFTVILLGGAFAAGLVGSLTGLGGGIIIVPLLTLGFHVDIRYAIGASLVSVIATSSGSAAAFVKQGLANLRLGLFLEIATTSGAIAGTFVAALIAPNAIGIIFGVLLLYSAYRSFRHRETTLVAPVGDRWAQRLRLDASAPSELDVALPDGVHPPLQPYGVQAVPTGFAIMFGAGIISGLLGIGSGVLKVLAMDQAMRLPYKVSTTTSNFMIGVTAAASAGVYLHQGYINPLIAFPVLLGVLAGATTGSHILASANTKILRTLFSWVIVILALQMIYNGYIGTLSPHG